MVLIAARQFIILSTSALLLNACTHLQTADDNRVPESKVVPVISEPPERIEQTPPETAPEAQKAAPANNLNVPAIPGSDASSTGKTSAPKKNEVLEAILQQASKAINNGQWLRAQHHLEHALRIAPQHAQTFYLYAHVYQGLGIRDRTVQMLKRALFLSRPDSALHQTVKQELEGVSE